MLATSIAAGTSAQRSQFFDEELLLDLAALLLQLQKLSKDQCRQMP